MESNIDGFVPIRIIEDEDNTETLKLVQPIDGWEDCRFWASNILNPNIVEENERLKAKYNELLNLKIKGVPELKERIEELESQLEQFNEIREKVDDRFYRVNFDDKKILDLKCGRRTLGDILKSIIEHYISGTPNGIYMDHSTI